MPSLFMTIIALSLLLMPHTAHAYLDPGTGSYIFQILIASLLGIIMGIKIFWHGVKAFCRRILNHKEKPGQD